MKLPNGVQAHIDQLKVTDYCLSLDHEDGRHKAHVFQRDLGLTLGDADALLGALRQSAASGDAVLGKRDKYGQRYVIDFQFTGPGGTATIRSAWIIGPNESVPRLVTCFIWLWRSWLYFCANCSRVAPRLEPESRSDSAT